LTQKTLVLVKDLSVTAIERYAAKLSDGGKSARTIQAAKGNAKSFSRWLTMSGKIPRDPLASVIKPTRRAIADESAECYSLVSGNTLNHRRRPGRLVMAWLAQTGLSYIV
jgi:site-specific recombinase XerC